MAAIMRKTTSKGKKSRPRSARLSLPDLEVEPIVALSSTNATSGTPQITPRKKLAERVRAAKGFISGGGSDNYSKDAAKMEKDSPRSIVVSRSDETHETSIISPRGAVSPRKHRKRTKSSKVKRTKSQIGTSFCVSVFFLGI